MTADEFWSDEEWPDRQNLDHVACAVGDRRPDIDGDIREVVEQEMMRA